MHPISRALNRAVTGSMNELLYQAKGYLIEEELFLYDTSFRLNQIPMGRLKYALLKESFARQKMTNEDVSNKMPGHVTEKPRFARLPTSGQVLR